MKQLPRIEPEKKRHFDLSIIKKIILVFILLILIFMVYYLFFSFKNCSDSNCFYSSLKNCRKASWIKEDNESAWKINIFGNVMDYKKDSCKVKFKLLNLKKGTIDSETLMEKEMICNVMKTETNFPPADMYQCTGILKEEIQDILIKRMHDYLLRNIGELKQEFRAV